MTDTEILRKALERYRNATANNTAFKDDVIVFLEKEIDSYREKLERMENNVERMAEKNQRLKLRLNAIYGVQSAAAITLEERTSDGGTMTLATHTKYEEVQEILLRNGYFVTSHFEDENSEDETITIEFWRA